MKINLDWIQKELDAGREVKLEPENSCYISEDNYVLSIDGDGLVVGIGTGKMWLSPDSFKHFRIKQAPTFDDLIDVATKAAKDGLLEINKLNKDFITAKLPGNHDFSFLTSYRHKPQNFEKDILSVNSLYTETFVIESESDVSRIKYGAKAKTLTGFTLTSGRDEDTGAELMWSGHLGGYCSMDFCFLKGATVTQKRS